MPNYCECDLYVSCKEGQESELDSFIAGAESQGIYQQFPHIFDFNSFIPYPETLWDADRKHQIASDALMEQFKDYERPFEGEIQKQYMEARNAIPKDGYNQGGYEWCNHHWGTKWNAGDASLLRLSPLKVRYSFRTAWAPPKPVIERAAQIYPSLRFELHYFERGIGFSGVIIYENGRPKKERVNYQYRGKRGG